MRKINLFVLLGGTLILLLFVTSCTQEHLGNTNTPPQNKVNLSLVHTFTRQDQQGRLDILKKYASEIEKQNPGLSIQMSAVEEKIFRDNQLPIEMTVGNQPDIFDLFGGSDLKRYASAGRLLDLTDFLEESGLKDQFAKGALDEFTLDGHVYGLPRAGYAEGFFYNKQIFQQLGVEVPKTLEDLINIVKKSKEAGITPIALGSKDAWVPGMLLNALIIRHTGIDQFKDLTRGAYQWTNPQMEAAWKDFALLNQLNAFPTNTLGMTYNDQIQYFENKHAALVYTGTWSVPYFTGMTESDFKKNIGFFLFPLVPGGEGDQSSINAGFSNGWGFSANVTEAQKQAIYQFIKVTWSKTIQKKLLIQSDLLPAVTITDTSGVDPLMVDVLKTMNQATSAWPAYDSIVSKSIQDVFNQELQRVIGKKDTPTKALAKLQNVATQQQ